MKNVDELIPLTRSEIGKAVNDKKAESGSIINRVFHNLKLIFPAWRQNFKTESEFNLTKSLWLETLIDEKITTQEQIERALKCARSHDSPFFPSIGQFVKWSKKEIPRVNEAAYQEYKPKISPHTRDEYAEMGNRGMANLRNNLNNTASYSE
jgi:hypothetical protein